MKCIDVAVVCGGDSSESEISILGARNIYEQLNKLEFCRAKIAHISKEGWHVELGEKLRSSIDKNDFSFTDIDGGKVVFDYAFINIHGTPGENGVLQSYFDLISIPYSSCGAECSMITFNKMLSKRVLSGSSIKVAKDIIINRGESYSSEEIVEKLNLPIFVKPNCSGSSFGVSKVKSVDDVEAAVEEAFKEGDTVIIEQFISGREFSQGVYSFGETVESLPLTEIVSKREFFDYKAKYEGASSEITPADLDSDIALKIANQAKLIYKLVQCRGYVRIDFIVMDGDPYFIELNSVPGMSSESIIPQQIRAAGMDIPQFLQNIIKNSYKK